MVRLFYINLYSRFTVGGKLFQYVLSLELNAQILVIGMVLRGKFKMVTFVITDTWHVKITMSSKTLIVFQIKIFSGAIMTPKI